MDLRFFINHEFLVYNLENSLLSLLIVDYATGVESMQLTSAEFEERGEAERLNCTS